MAPSTAAALAIYVGLTLAAPPQAAEAAKAPESFSASVSPREARIGEQVRYTIEIHHPKGDRYELPEQLDLDPFPVVRRSRSVKESGDQAVSTFTLELLVLENGEKNLPDLSFAVQSPAGPRSLTVPGPPVKGSSGLSPDAELKDIAPPVGLSVWRWRALFLALAAAAVLAGLYCFYRKLKRRPEVAALPVPELPPHEWALKQLHELKTLDLVGQGRKRELYFRTSEILRGYLKRRFDFEALEMTTEELLAALRRTSTPGLDYASFSEFCGEADLVKFAKLEPNDGQCQSALEAALLLVHRTAPLAPAAQLSSLEAGGGSPLP